MDFPLMVYRDGGQFQRPGGTYSFKSVSDDVELSSSIADGWSLTFPGSAKTEAAVAAEKSAEEVADNAPPTREELVDMAKRLGLKFGPNTGSEKLAKMIDEALSQNAANAEV